MPLKSIENPQVYSSIDKVVLDNQLIYTVDDALRNVTGVQRMWVPITEQEMEVHTLTSEDSFLLIL
jgi:outer membrane receptor for ferric coprogen and ferric-rhodotorulic acid